MLKDSTNKENMNKLSYLIYGLGKSGNSVIKYFKKKKLKVIMCGMIIISFKENFI